eukprot:NODE_188_length_15619_cov_0.374871.p8 type:complete len:131 gc:universal NODE_188_length_15619_cov_0.374871:13443-13835(+)
MGKFTVSLVLIHVLLISSSLYIYKSFFTSFTAFFWLVLLTAFSIGIIFKGAPISQALYAFLSLGTLGYELYRISTYKDFVDSYDTYTTAWIQNNYLAFAITHALVGMCTSGLTIFRLRIYKKKVVVKHIL